MPELPDIEVYIEALETRVRQTRLTRIQVASPFLLRTVRPPINAVEGETVVALHRVGKRIVMEFTSGLWLVMHLMIAGRLHWSDSGGKPLKRITAALLQFESGILTLTESGTQKRASLHLIERGSGLAAIDPGGLEVLTCNVTQFREALTRENHTVKRALTDPRIISGIGNAYSDEILHAARVSPVVQTHKLSPEHFETLHAASQSTLRYWKDLLRTQAGNAFPENVTAFRPEMAVHGKFGQPCPVCGSKVQRIRYVNNETNYCPACQTGGKLLADRSLSLLLRKDWPRTPEELEELRCR